MSKLNEIYAKLEQIDKMWPNDKCMDIIFNCPNLSEILESNEVDLNQNEGDIQVDILELIDFHNPKYASQYHFDC